MKGFKSPKEFFSAVIGLSQRESKHAEDPRVKFLAAAGSDEQSGQSDPYGGLLVPVGMTPGVQSIGADQNPFIQRATQLPMQVRTIDVLARVDKNHSTSVSGGLTVSRRDETSSIASSRMELEKIQLKATGLFGLAYSTRELMQDSPLSIQALLSQGFADEFPAQIFNEMINGNTPGKLEGIINSPATVTVAKESGQAADTINGTNLIKMYQRAWRPSADAFWLANYDTYVQLVKAHTTLTSDDYPMFIHGNGTNVPSTLLGHSIVFTEFCPTLGDKGDIIFVSNPSQYLYGVYQPLRSEESMHVRFENHEQAFKFWIENAGASWWRSPLTPKNGANTLAPFVTLAARA
jgi:HK97 family phage major capsid protein